MVAVGRESARAQAQAHVRCVGSRHGPARQGRSPPRPPHSRGSAAAPQRVGRGERRRDRPCRRARDRVLERRGGQRPRLRRRTAADPRADARSGRRDRRRRRPARDRGHGGRLRRRARGRCRHRARCRRGRGGRAQHGGSERRRRAICSRSSASLAKIAAVRAVGDETGIPLVLNARTDVFLGQVGDPGTRLERAVERGRAYLAAGADCIFVPGVDRSGRDHRPRAGHRRAGERPRRARLAAADRAEGTRRRPDQHRLRAPTGPRCRSRGRWPERRTAPARSMR